MPRARRVRRAPVPAAFAGAFVIDRLAGQGLEDAIKHLLGWMLLVAGIVVYVVWRKTRRAETPVNY